MRQLSRDDDKTFLYLAIIAAVFVAVAFNRNAPLPARSIPVDVATLPYVPPTAELDGTPRQTEVPDRTVDLGDGFHARLLHGYVLEGLVVTRREFSSDAASPISPLDLGITWGELADPDRADDFRFQAGRRMVSYRAQSGAILAPDWETQITNNHLIPASEAVRDALLAVEVGQTVRIRGYLVVASGETLAPWRSSTRRDDNTIIGGCEIILVSSVEILTEDPATTPGPELASKS